MLIKKSTKDYLDYQKINFIILFVCIAPIFLSFIMVTDEYQSKFNIFGHYINFNSSCAFYQLTGYDCPSCRMTRSFVYISDFNFVNAFQMKISAILLYLFLIFQIFYRIFLILKRKLFLNLLIFQSVFAILIIIVNLSEFIYQFFD